MACFAGCRRELSVHTSQRAFPIHAAIENAEDYYVLIVNLEGDRYAPFEADDAKPRSNVVAALAALRSMVEGFAISGYALDESQRVDRTAGIRNVVVNLLKVVSCPGRPSSRRFTYPP
jgi:hypothetical protein